MQAFVPANKVRWVSQHSIVRFVLAGGQISARRATGLAYIASLLLRTLPAIDKQLGLNEPTHFEIDVPARGCVGMSPGEIPPTLPDLTSFEEVDPSACLPRQGPAPRNMFRNNLQLPHNPR